MAKATSTEKTTARRSGAGLSVGPARWAEPATGVMKPAWERYDLGDMVTARQIANQVLKNPQANAQETEQAKDLLWRTRLPIEVYLIGLGALVMLVLLWFLAVHRGALAS